MTLDADTCWRAMLARDARFDGVFFVGVKTTGVYCRPICPARTPGRDRCEFYRRAVEAERAGFRACLRCRPELAPGSASVDAIDRLVAQAVPRLEAGASIERVAGDLSVSARHLRRALRAGLGVSPIELVQSRRMALAKQLLQETSLPIAEIAFASGFHSVRRFNAAFHDRFGGAPSMLRRQAARTADAIALRLDYRPPLHAGSLLAFLGARAIPGVESIVEGAYRRTVRVGDACGIVTVRFDPDRPALRAEIPTALLTGLVDILARLRRLFDLDAHPSAIDERLGSDARLRGCVRARPGLRVPGAFDGFEIAVRSILGQQVSVKAATTLSGRLAHALGEALPNATSELGRLSPSAAAIADAGPDRLAQLGLPRARAQTLVALAQAVRSAALDLDGSDVEPTIAALQSIPGIGPWTAQYIAMRALRWPDAFPAGDLVLRRALGDLTPAKTDAMSQRWQPWRAYAAMHLWMNA